MKEIILVDANDNIIGYDSKMAAHKNAALHRAFSVFIYSTEQEKMLLQKRATNKYHSGGLWSNACCSHPRKGEIMLDALNSRIMDELGVPVAAEGICTVGQYAPNMYVSSGKFTYMTKYDTIYEHEIDHVFVLMVDKRFPTDVPVSQDEVSDYKWVSIKELRRWYNEFPNQFTSWFLPAFELAIKTIELLRG